LRLHASSPHYGAFWAFFSLLTSAVADAGIVLCVAAHSQARRWTSRQRRDRARFAEVEESVVWEARFPGGAISHCSSSYDAVGVGYFRVLAERGWFGLDPAFNYGGLRNLRIVTAIYDSARTGKPIELRSA
jgi:hypothetical protein